MSFSDGRIEDDNDGQIDLPDALEDVVVHLTVQENSGKDDKDEPLSHIATIDENHNP